MRKLIILLLAVFVAVPTAAALDRKQTQALVRIAQQASGLKARKQVRVVVERPAEFTQRRLRLLDRSYSRSAQDYDETIYRALGLTSGGKGILRRTLVKLENSRGVYDPVAKIAYVRAGAGERATALHEIVHALQDQHYNLRRASQLSGGSDESRAAAAVADGHALLVANVLAPRGAASPAAPKLQRFLELERGFVSTVGLRFAADLRNLGGNKALLGALGRLPATSEQVFHLDKYLERERAIPVVLPVDAGGMKLVGDDTFGELDVRALLAVFGVPRLDRVGRGWGGGRTAVYRGGGGQAVLVALDWDTEVDARQWAEAVAIYVDEAFDAARPGLPATTPCAADACWQLGARSIAFSRDGVRTSLAIGASIEPVAALAREALGLESSVSLPRVDP